MSGLRSDLRAGHAPGAYPTLDTDLCDGGGSAKKRICIATPEIAGVAGSGGIGTTYGHLARHLAQWGHDVVIAYVNVKASDTHLMDEARAFYARSGVDFEAIVPLRCDDSVREQVSAPAMVLLDWLRARERAFDIVHVSEWRGLGYGALLAKSLGMAFGSTHFVVKASSPLLWLAEANRRFISSEYELGLVFLEKRSIELADTVICGSAYLLEWMRDAGYAVPARTFVWPNLFPEPASATAAGYASRDGAKLQEVVFFGRLEPRKGLVVFVDAIDWLVRRGRAPQEVTFLGGPVGLIDGPGLIRDRSQQWPTTVKLLTDLGSEEAVAYLSKPGRLAVIPSLIENSSIAVTECLQAGIPFVAAATGGTPELVAPEDRSRALVAPDHSALGERIAELSDAPLRAVRPRWSFERALRVWARWHAQTAPFEAAAKRFAERERNVDTVAPLVTVCVVHHERPALVRMAVDSVLDQDYPALEAVLIDDGSESTEAHTALDALETEFAERGWRVIRQENRYLGAARNAAAMAARGEWLLFLDDDNVLLPDAVSRLVRAACFSDADSVTAASIRFSGEGDPRLDTDSHGAPIRFFGAALASNLFHNVVGDACALVRRKAFERVGGFDEERGFAFSDMSFFSSLRQAGLRVEYMPEVAFYYRVLPESMFRSADRHSAMHRHLVTKPYLDGLPAEERAFASYAIGHIDQFKGPKSLAESAMRRGDWRAACAWWAALRESFPDQAAGYVQGAQALLNAGRFEEAEALAGEAVVRFPERPGGYLRRAEAAMRRRDWTAACQWWAALRESFSDQAAGYVQGAQALLNAGRLEEAEALASEAAERFPARPGGHYQRAEVAMRRGEWAEACERWSALRQSFSDQAAGYVQGAQALLNVGRPEEAESLAGEAVARFPERPGGYLHRAEAAMRRRDWSAACEWWSELRQFFSDQAAGYEQGAQALLNVGRLGEAESLAGEAVARFPERPGGYHRRAEAAMRRHDWSAACQWWSELCQSFPNEAAGYEQGVQALLNVGRLGEAESLAGEAVARFPERPGGYLYRAEAAMRRGDWTAACAWWAALRETFPDQAAGYEQGAQALLNAERAEEAESLADEAVSCFPERPAGYHRRAEAAMRRRDWTAACHWWAALRDTFPDQAAGYVQGAQALLHAGRLEEAEALAGEAVARFPERAGGYLHRAEAAMRRRDWTAAYQWWAALRETFPDQAAGYVQGAQALLNVGRLEEAEALAGEAVARFPERAGGYLHRAEAAMRRRDWTAACEWWSDLRQSFFDQAAGYVQGAQALLHAGRLEEAEALAGEAVARFPERPAGYHRRAEAAMRRRDWTAACQWWSELRQFFPDEAAGYVQGAQALLNAGRLEEAEALAGEAVARFPERPGGYRYRAEAAMRRCDWPAACRWWEELNRTFSDYASGYLRGATLVRRELLPGIGHLDAVVRFDPNWAARASRGPERGPILELRRNGRAVKQAFVKDLLHDVVRFAAGPHTPVHGEALYSFHDARNGDVLAALVVPAFLQARRIVGAVENRRGSEIRGWLLDRGDPEHSRRVAVHVDGRLREVVSANSRRDDIARWKGANGRHGFHWRLPEELVGKEWTRVDVFDADTGRSLRGSPVRIESGRAAAAGRHGT